MFVGELGLDGALGIMAVHFPSLVMPPELVSPHWYSRTNVAEASRVSALALPPEYACGSRARAAQWNANPRS